MQAGGQTDGNAYGSAYHAQQSCAMLTPCRPTW